MARNRPVQVLATVVAAGAIILLPAQRGAAATCVSDPATVAAVDVAFVGTLSGVSPSGDEATFGVKEVWNAGNLAPVVVVHASPGWFSSSAAGDYLVLASLVDGTLRLGGGECDVAMPWDPSFANVRPATAHAPRASGADSSGVPVELLALLGVAGLLVGVSAFAFRRTRAPAE